MKFNDLRFNIVRGQNLEVQNLQAEDAGTYLCLLNRNGYEGNIILTSLELEILDSAPVDRRNDPCFGNPCGENAECYTQKGKPVCSCRPNYRGTPPNCVEYCLRNKYCYKLACLSNRCEDLCKRSCELQENASCRIQNNKWTCQCNDGLLKNSSDECGPEKLEQNQEETCGLECLLFSIIGPILFLLVTATVIFCIIKRRRKSHDQDDEDEVEIHPFSRFAENLSECYDEKWEFSRERLIIKDCIGEGQFGRVLKAQASGIAENEGTIIVAVKTLKENATDSQLEDLISEYESLKELNHPNVICLLGACTKDGPFYIIMEYAENGSLRCFLQNIKRERITAPSDMERIYTPVYSNLQPKTILNFAWQVAKGMSYLAEMKYVHRDLAARNILLTKDLICKISDFGLTRDVYRDGEYLRTSKGKVPIKWIAIESLYTDCYTTKSDVWSFGIVLWELITFGANPYPGLQLRDVYNFLKEGNRMEKPEGCSNDFYKIMQRCWKEDPADRPDFQDLVIILNNMISADIDYLECNDEDQDGYLKPRLHQNSKVCNESHSEAENLL